MICLNANMWIDAQCQALKVDFLETKEEFYHYAKVLYEAMMWGEKSKEKQDEETEEAPVPAPKSGKVRTWVRREDSDSWGVVYKAEGDRRLYVFDERVTRLAAANRIAEMIESPDFYLRLVERRKREKREKIRNLTKENNYEKCRTV